MNAREAAQRALHAVVLDGRSLNEALPATLSQIAEQRDRAFAQELVYGVLRWMPRLEFMLGTLMQRPLRSRDRDVQLLLLTGLYQLLYTRVPPHAAVSETIDGCTGLGKPWAGALANAVLRRLSRERDAIERLAERDLAGRYAHPAWMIDAVRAAWPEEWQAVLDAANEHPPMTLRVNRRHGDAQRFLARLAAAGIPATPCRHATDGVVLARPTDPVILPGFAEGEFSVQDAAAQLAAPLLDAPPGARILDACAAPGGKTAHLLERDPQARVTAVDSSAERLGLVRSSLDRLGLDARLVAADAGAPTDWWDGTPFDRILLDAPCTATGVIRRHPDIKHHRRAADTARLREIQARLLDALWPLLTRGGLLLYATCSILPVENAQQIAEFLVRTPDAREQSLDVSWGRRTSPGRQILPHDERMDGFYYALLQKS